MKRHIIRLYNLIFPIWIFWMVPSLLWLLLPANFLWDSLVLLAAFVTVSGLRPSCKGRRSCGSTPSSRFGSSALLLTLPVLP